MKDKDKRKRMEIRGNTHTDLHTRIYIQTHAHVRTKAVMHTRRHKDAHTRTDAHTRVDLKIHVGRVGFCWRILPLDVKNNDHLKILSFN